MNKPKITLLWRNADNTSVEYFTLHKNVGCYTLDGRVILLLEHTPTKITYQVLCDSNWRTKQAKICQETTKEKRRLTLAVGDNQQWYANNKPLPFATELFDVDLEVSPATNTLPLNRLTLAVGESKETTAVWVRFPSLAPEPLRQRYTRLSERLYRYEAPQIGFEAQLEVDDAGLVMKYGELWMRIA